jgi:aminoglycoside phosphotransferase (APT) family kinase protein
MEAFKEIIQTIYNDHPQFQNTTQRENDEGWDNLVIIMDERVVFRIPRNEISRRQMQVEMHFLPQISAVSPLPVPLYKYFSKEPGLYAGYDLIPGIPFTRDVFEKSTNKQQKKIAQLLGVQICMSGGRIGNPGWICNQKWEARQPQCWNPFTNKKFRKCLLTFSKKQNSM